jgi:rhodanese-related sulfurtransferase
MTSWIVTAFASKTQNFAKVFYLWESIVRSGHRFFICIVCVALLDIHKERILQQDIGSVLVYLSSISLDSEEVINKLIKKSYEFLYVLPKSIITWLDAFDMLELAGLPQKSKILETFLFFKILPNDYLKAIYPEAFWTQGNSNSFVLIDLRAEEDFKNGHFPNSAFFDKKYLQDIEKVENFVQNFEGVKGFSHFVIMQQQKLSKAEINRDGILLANAFLKKGFEFVSFAFGGFLEAHRVVLSKGLTLRKHQTEECKACAREKKSPKKFVDFFWPSRRRVKSYECLDKEPDFLQFTSWII